MIEKEKTFKKFLRMEICREMLIGYSALVIRSFSSKLNSVVGTVCFCLLLCITKCRCSYVLFTKGTVHRVFLCFLTH
jgi:hypothetical protein